MGVPPRRRRPVAPAAADSGSGETQHIDDPKPLKARVERKDLSKPPARKTHGGASWPQRPGSHASSAGIGSALISAGDHGCDGRVEPYAGLLHVFVCEQRPSHRARAGGEIGRDNGVADTIMLSPAPSSRRRCVVTTFRAMSISLIAPTSAPERRGTTAVSLC
jgi:hypothetical protein